MLGGYFQIIFSKLCLIIQRTIRVIIIVSKLKFKSNKIQFFYKDNFSNGQRFFE